MDKKMGIFLRLPYFIQDFLVTLYNVKSYRIRHRGVYKERLKYYSRIESLSKEEWQDEQTKKLSNFLNNVTSSSKWFAPYQKHDLKGFPVLEKADVIKNLGQISTISESEGIVSLTGGTTGASMKVLYTEADCQERFAILDAFRASFGYTLGKKVAWFSGKNLATERDVIKGRCYRDDLANKIRFFSTFHINERHFESYWNALNQFAPEFLVGFPSSIFEICMMAKQRNLSLGNKVKVFFPTAEVVLDEHRAIIGEVLGCKLVDQYASSEGAPFILECEYGGLHIHPLTGIFEVVDDNLNPTDEGEMLVTSFTTHGTPLVRYRIGDRIKLAESDKICKCGSTFPLVERIDGRVLDFIYSPQNGKVNLGNLSNSTKDVKGIVCFQVQQDVENCIDVRIVKLPTFTSDEERKFVSAMKERVGESMNINVFYVDEIQKEKSGKFKIVRNNLSNLDEVR